MRDLTSVKAMVTKALLFLVLATLSAAGLWLSAPALKTLLLALLLAWSAARFY